MIYSGHRGCLAGQIILQGHTEKKNPAGFRLRLKTKRKRPLKLNNRQTIRLAPGDNLAIHFIGFNDGRCRLYMENNKLIIQHISIIRLSACKQMWK